jgi:hypothetical protein
MDRTVSFGRLIFPNLPLRLIPVLNRLAFAMAAPLAQFIGSLGDLRRHSDRFLGY